MNLQTKADFTALMHKFLDPLKPYYSAGCARLHLGETGVTYTKMPLSWKPSAARCGRWCPSG